jgi:hypothetical protein
MFSRDETAELYVPKMPPGGGPRGRPLRVNVALRAGEGLEAISGLRSEVEVARHLGNLPAARIAEAMVRGGVATEEEITVGKMAGMATGYSAAAGSFGDPSRAKRPQDIAAATEVRRGSYAVIFERLRQVVNDPNNQLLTTPGGASLVALARAFEQWLNTALDQHGRVRPGPEAEQAARTLQARLILFLRQRTEEQ